MLWEREREINLFFFGFPMYYIQRFCVFEFSMEKFDSLHVWQVTTEWLRVIKTTEDYRGERGGGGGKRETLLECRLVWDFRLERLLIKRKNVSISSLHVILPWQNRMWHLSSTHFELPVVWVLHRLIKSYGTLWHVLQSMCKCNPTKYMDQIVATVHRLKLQKPVRKLQIYDF